LDLEEVKRKCTLLRNKNSRAGEIMRFANGDLDYKEIGKKLRINETIVSGVLKAAYDCGLASKKSGIYKKRAGILSFLPKSRSKTSGGKIEKIIGRVEKARHKEKTSGTFYNLHNSDKMGEAYVYLYLTENALRNLIRLAFEKELNWWATDRVPPDVRADVARLMAKEKYDGVRRKDELEYTHLDHLKKIIICGRNWPLTKGYLHELDKTKVGFKMEDALQLRNAIAHSIELGSDDLVAVKVKFVTILKMIK